MAKYRCEYVSVTYNYGYVIVEANSAKEAAEHRPSAISNKIIWKMGDEMHEMEYQSTIPEFDE